MLLRAYRITDRFGVALLKSSVALCTVTLDGLTVVRRGASGLLMRIVLVIAAVFALLWRLVRMLFSGLRPVASASGRVSKNVARSTARASTRAVQSAGGAANEAMARRAARAEIKARVVEDPLKRQNRLLSGLVVVLGVAVLVLVLWATDPSRVPTTGTLSAAAPPAVLQASGLQAVGDGATPQATSESAIAAAPTLSSLPTTVPTATALPSVLSVRGTMAFVARENAQDDIWAIPVGSRTPLRLTNSLEDERDPAWSPDGQRLAYASRQDGNWEIYVYELSSGDTTRMTYDLSFQANPSWSPDGEWLAYESYQGNNLDIYVMRIDGSQTPLRLTDHPEPDFAPAWSPDGRTIAFTSWRGGNQDIYLFSLDDPRDEAVVNVTNTPQRNEDYAAWSPDGTLLTYSALDEGVEKVFVKSVLDLDAPAQALERGRTPSWSPDGVSLVYAVDSLDGTQLIAGAFAGAGVATEIFPVGRGANSPSWTSAPLPQRLVNSGGLAAASNEPLYMEQVNDATTDPPYRLRVLANVNAPNAVLSERVNDSFMALREQAADVLGWDLLGRLEDAFWQIDRPPQPGEERRNWLMTGRAVAINRNLIVGFPAPVEVVREDLGVDTYWRVYVRVSDDAQSGQLGEPLRRMPWDFASRNQGDVNAYDNGGRVRAEMPSGYYVDLTQLAQDYGWQRVPAGSDWRRNFNSTNYWLLQRPEGLAWYDAMRELYTEAQLGGFAPRAATAVPNPLALTQAVPTNPPPPPPPTQPESEATADESA
jgi:TolB protein